MTTQNTLTIADPVHPEKSLVLTATEKYCPECGAKNVWLDEARNDFVLGPMHHCAMCAHAFSLPEIAAEKPSEYDAAVARGIRNSLRD